MKSTARVHRNTEARSKDASGHSARRRLPHVLSLLKTTALTTVALTLSGATAYSGQSHLWQPHVRTMVGGTTEGRGTALLDTFLPLDQTPDSAVFLDVRTQHDFDGGFGQDFGVGVRRIVNPDLMVGGYGFFDTEEVGGHRFNGATLGIEAITPKLDAHLNAFLPFSRGTHAHDSRSRLSMVGNELLERISTFDQRRYAEWGIEGAVGVQAPVNLPENQSLRLDFGGYHFGDYFGNGRSATGAKAGFEYTIGDVLGRGSKLAFTGEVRYDDRDKSQFAAGLQLTVPLESPPEPVSGDSRAQRAIAASSGLQKRLNERIRGDIGVHVRTETSRTQTSRVAISAVTGQAFGDFFFADGHNTLGLGTLGDPTTLDDAVTKAGAGGFAVALGGSGNLNTAGIALANGETVIGGGGHVTARLADGTVRDFDFGGTNGTVNGTNPATDVITLADNSAVRDLTVTGGNVGMAGSDVSDATLADVTVTGAASSGVSFTGTSTGITGMNLTANANGGDGLHIEGDGVYNFFGTTTLSGNGDDGLDASGNGSYAFETLNTLDNTSDGIRVSGVSTGASFSTTGGTVSGNGGTGVYIDPVTANVTLDSVSQDGGAAGIVLGQVSGSFTVTGDTTISNTSGSAIQISDSPAAIRFGNIAITDPGQDGIAFDGVNAGVTAGNIAISGIGAGGTGLNFYGSQTTFTAQSTDISGSGAGSIGIDLAHTIGNAPITVTNGGMITGVDTGIRLGIAGTMVAYTANATFTFGGGSVGGTTASLDMRGLSAGRGTYAFGTTTFNGPQLVGGTKVVFVGSAATGRGDGSTVNDLASIDTADAITNPNTVFALVNDGSPIVTNSGFTLSDYQTLASFGDGRTFYVSGAPANVTGDNVLSAITQSDPTGNGAATLAAGAGAGTTVTLGSGDFVADLSIANTNTDGIALGGTGIAGLTASDVSLNGAGFGLSLSGATGNIDLSSLNVTGAALKGAGISIDSSNATIGIHNLSLDVAPTLGVGVDLTDNVGSDISIDGTTTIHSGGAGVNFSGGGKLEISGTSTIGATGNSAIRVDANGGDLTVGLSGVTATGSQGRPAINIDGTGGGQVTIDNFSDLTVTSSGTEGGGIVIAGGDGGATLPGQPVQFGSGTAVAGGNLTIGTTGSRVQGYGLILNNVQGALSFDSINIANDGGTGLGVFNPFLNPGDLTLTNAGGSIDTINGTAVQMDPLTVDMTFASLSSTSSPTSGAAFQGVSGSFTVTGTTNITGPLTSGLSITSSPANFAFGDTTITGPGTGNGIDIEGPNGTTTFGDVAITGIGDGQTGLDLSGSLTNLTASSLDITGSGTSTGIDLSGTQAGSRTVITNGGTIQGVGTGVQMGTHGAGAASADDDFTFGGGSIAGTTASLDMRGLSASMGTYGFGSTTFTGPQLSDAGNVKFVGSSATGAADGSSVNDLESIDTADANTDPGTVFVLVNDGSPIVDSTGFTLSDGQTLASFGNGRTIDIGGAPANVTGDNIEADHQQSDPTGNGAATLAGSGTVDTLTLGSGDLVEDVDIAGTASGNAIIGTGITGFTARGVRIEGGVQGLRLNNVSGTINLSNISVSNTADDGIHIQNSRATLTATGTIAVSSAGGDGIELAGASNGAASFGTVHVAGAGARGLVLNGLSNSLDMTALTIDGGNAGVDIINGTTSTATFGAASSITNPTGTAFHITGASPTVTYDGTITQNEPASAVVINTMNGGSVTFGGQITAHTSTATAINLKDAAGAPISFTGGLEITTTSADSFRAFRNAGLTITGTDNTISSGTGQALVVVNTNIGAAGLTFRSISADGAPSGIVIGDTGSVGGLTVTGTGTAGSGGTIRNITYRGVAISNATNITLNNMNFVNSSMTESVVATTDNADGLNAGIYLTDVNNVSLDNDHISGTNQEGVIAVNVHNFAFNNGSISGAGNAAEEGAMKMQELTGLVTMNNDDLSFSAAQTVEITNTTGDLILNIDNTTMRDTQASPTGGDGLQLTLTAASGLPLPSATVNVTNSKFLRLAGAGIDMWTNGGSSIGASGDVDITGSTFDPGAGNMAGVVLSAVGSSNLVFNVMDNTKIYSRNGPAVNILGADNAHVEGRINDNPDIRVLGGVGTGIRVNMNDDSTGAVQIDNNLVNIQGFDHAIEASSLGHMSGPGGTLDVSITNNVATLGPIAAEGIYLLVATSSGETNKMTANVAGNAVTSSSGLPPFWARATEVTGTMLLQNFTFDPAATWNANGNTPPEGSYDAGNGSFGEGTPSLPTNGLPDADP